MEITYQSRAPSKEQYYALFETTGWNEEYHLTPEELALTVSNSQFVVSAYAGPELVGFGRVHTDGIMHAMIYEMIVHPDHQRRGIGTQILERLLAWCKENHIREVQLFCATGKRGFYEQSGFFARPPDAPGMQLRRDA